MTNPVRQPLSALPHVRGRLWFLVGILTVSTLAAAVVLPADAGEAVDTKAGAPVCNEIERFIVYKFGFNKSRSAREPYDVEPDYNYARLPGFVQGAKHCRVHNITDGDSERLYLQCRAKFKDTTELDAAFSHWTEAIRSCHFGPREHSKNGAGGRKKTTFKAIKIRIRKTSSLTAISPAVLTVDMRPSKSRDGGSLNLHVR